MMPLLFPHERLYDNEIFSMALDGTCLERVGEAPSLPGSIAVWTILCIL